MFSPGNRWRDSGILILLLAAVGVLIWWLNEPMSDVLAAASDVRAWIVGFGPLAPIAYVAFFAAQILIAPLPGSFLSVLGGYLFGFGAGLLLSLLGLTVGVTLALLIGRKLGRPLLERFFARSELIRWERKLRLRSPLIWFVIFLFPLPDLVIYVAGLGTTPLRQLAPAILLGRGLGIVVGSSIGVATASLPASFVLVQWVLFLLLGGLAYRFQRPIRYHLLMNMRRTRRLVRGMSRSPIGTPVE
ncbi:VTT domain-containing protein [Caldilinea sp.]|uniref:TVP38/TMEM64 family protein n=1 Tax=Caldilinea sp. TaxID=2293560 RepID=UPI002BFD6B72|nr:VTT domain-containing protein [Caldilinea sp.]